jgi:hypothetical protein
MMPAASRPLVCGYFRLLRAVPNRGETDKVLIMLKKLSAVSRFHRFLGMLPWNFDGDRRPIKIPEALFHKNVKRRNGHGFIVEYQWLACFTRA